MEAKYGNSILLHPYNNCDEIAWRGDFLNKFNHDFYEYIWTLVRYQNEFTYVEMLKKIIRIQLNEGVVILTKISSLAAPEVVIMATSGAATDAKFRQNDISVSVMALYKVPIWFVFLACVR